ncbi:MAG TPA: tRNA epoxyqueuosine(34) reductase QueG [Tepidisphaeraceae bacterium]|jgi:epoxyqueuosine reductase|nr:tRNA epoxyqueuosine(34) reductase QueG [Tepidisphaeraceae bacterium]
MIEAGADINPNQLAAEIKQRARSLGFDLVGIASAQPSKYRDYFRQWLDDGQHGSMEYLAKRFDERVDPATYVPGAKSVICVALNYHAPLAERAASETGKIARYALGDDYHEIIKPRLHQLADWICQIAPEAHTRCAVDTAPVMEKDLAARAGVGWIGKNTCVINEDIGSWIFLGEIITTLDLPPDEPAIDRCGTCRRCIDACPTGAITEPYQLDARKCISYLTIEHRGEINAGLQLQMGDWLYGCDICQDVCPWNNKAPWTNESSLKPRFASGLVDVNEILNWKAEDYSGRLRRSAIKRVKLPILQRNAAIVLENSNRQSR